MDDSGLDQLEQAGGSAAAAPQEGAHNVPPPMGNGANGHKRDDDKMDVDESEAEEGVAPHYPPGLAEVDIEEDWRSDVSSLIGDFDQYREEIEKANQAAADFDDDDLIDESEDGAGPKPAQKIDTSKLKKRGRPPKNAAQQALNLETDDLDESEEGEGDGEGAEDGWDWMYSNEQRRLKAAEDNAEKKVARELAQWEQQTKTNRFQQDIQYARKVADAVHPTHRFENMYEKLPDHWNLHFASRDLLFRVSRFPPAKSAEEKEADALAGIADASLVAPSQGILEGVFLRILAPNRDVTQPQNQLGRFLGFVKGNKKYDWKDGNGKDQPPTDVMVKVDMPIGGDDTIATLPLTMISNYVNFSTLGEYRVWITKKIEDHVRLSGAAQEHIPRFGCEPEKAYQYSAVWTDELKMVQQAVATARNYYFTDALVDSMIPEAKKEALMKGSVWYKEAVAIREAFEAQLKHGYNTTTLVDYKNEQVTLEEALQFAIEECDRLKDRCLNNQRHFEKRRHVWQVTFINNKNRTIQNNLDEAHAIHAYGELMSEVRERDKFAAMTKAEIKQYREDNPVELNPFSRRPCEPRNMWDMRTYNPDDIKMVKQRKQKEAAEADEMGDLFGDDDDDDADAGATGAGGASSSSSSSSAANGGAVVDLKTREAERRKKDEEARQHDLEIQNVNVSAAAKLFQLSASVKSPPGSPRRSGSPRGIGNGGIHKTLRDYAHGGFGGEQASKRMRLKL